VSVPAARPTGRFSYDVELDRWEWDDDVFRVHGYAPGAVEPTSKLVLESKHPDDRARVVAALERVKATGEAFSISYRLIGGDGVERRVVLVGEGNPPMCPGQVTSVEGYYIDLTTDFDEESEEAAHAAVEASAEHRAVIEQAKGALMLAYGLDEDAAFAMLRWWSRNRNVKVREVAQRLVDNAREGEATDSETRSAIDALLHDVTAAAPPSAGPGHSER
jgi:hypothetical protein